MQPSICLLAPATVVPGAADTGRGSRPAGRLPPDQFPALLRRENAERDKFIRQRKLGIERPRLKP